MKKILASLVFMSAGAWGMSSAKFQLELQQAYEGMALRRAVKSNKPGRIRKVLCDSLSSTCAAKLAREPEWEFDGYNFYFLDYVFEQHKRKIDWQNKYGNTLLHDACKNGNENAAKYLVDVGANVNIKNNAGKMPLHIACKNGNETIVRYLIAHGADAKGFPLTEAMNLNDEIIKLLIDRGADVNCLVPHCRE